MPLEKWISHAARVGAIVVLVLLLLDFISTWEEVSWEFETGKLAAALVAFGTWLGLEIRLIFHHRELHGRIQRRVMGGRDRQLTEEFDNLIDANTLLSLRNHDFGSPYRRSMMTPVYDLVETWQGGRYTFRDEQLGAVFEAVRVAALNLTEIAMSKTHAHPMNSDLGTVRLDPAAHQIDPMARRREAQAAAELNSAATEFVAAVDRMHELVTTFDQ